MHIQPIKPLLCLDCALIDLYRGLLQAALTVGVAIVRKTSILHMKGHLTMETTTYGICKVVREDAENLY